jgi:hypothetical protein
MREVRMNKAGSGEEDEEDPQAIPGAERLGPELGAADDDLIIR